MLNVVYFSEDVAFETLFINYLERSFLHDNLIILKLSQDIFDLLWIRIDLIILPFTPGWDTPFGKFVRYLLSNSYIVVSAEWRTLDKVSEQNYRKSHIQKFAEIGMLFTSWTVQTEQYLRGLIPLASIAILPIYYDYQNNKLNKKGIARELAVLVEFSELYWPQDIVKFKLRSGYSREMFAAVKKKQINLKKLIKGTIREFRPSDEIRNFDVYLISSAANCDFKKDIEDVSDNINFSVISIENIPKFMASGIKIICEPFIGLEQYAGTYTAVDETNWPLEVQNLSMLQVPPISKVQLRADKAGTASAENRACQHHSIQRYAAAISKGNMGKCLHHHLLFRLFFIRLIFYCLKQKTKGWWLVSPTVREKNR